MSENAFTGMQAIAALLIKKEGITGSSRLIILNTDTLTACSVQTLTDGQFSITGEWSFPPEKDFYTLAAELFYDSAQKSAHIFEICKDASSPLKQFIQLKFNESKNAVLDPSADITCRKLLDLYKEHFEARLKKALGEAIATNPSVNVYPVGRLAAFYPALHSVKEMLCAMPFAPAVPFLVDKKELFCDTYEFENTGKEILAEAEKKKRSVKGNILLVLKKLTPDGIADEFRLLAPAGASFADFTSPDYSESVFAHKDDSLRILADGNSFSVPIPADAFPANADSCVISLALLYDGEKLMLSVKNNDSTVCTELDKNIYS